MGKVSKEGRETLNWLRLLEEGNFIEFEFKELKSDCEEFIKLLTAIIKST
jgi:four helix bundle protein